MELLDEFIRMKDIEYAALMEKEKSKAEKAMQLLLSDEERMKVQKLVEETLLIEPENDDINKKATLALFIFPLYESLMFFRNDELIIRLREFELPEAVIRWFVSIEEINKQFDLITQKGIKIDKILALTYIGAYLKSKLWNDIIYWVSGLYMDGKTPVNFLAKSVILINDRKKDSKTNPKTANNPLDSILSETMEEFDQFIQGQDKFNISLIEFTKGKTEKTCLKNLLEDCFDYNSIKKLSNAKFLNAVYDLFRLLINDYNLPANENDFRYVSGLYNKKFERFKAIKLKKIIYKV